MRRKLSRRGKVPSWKAEDLTLDEGPQAGAFPSSSHHPLSASYRLPHYGFGAASATHTGHHYGGASENPAFVEDSFKISSVPEEAEEEQSDSKKSDDEGTRSPVRIRVDAPPLDEPEKQNKSDFVWRSFLCTKSLRTLGYTWPSRSMLSSWRWRDLTCRKVSDDAKTPSIRFNWIWSVY